MLERQFGYVKVRFKGPAKNTAQILMLLAISANCVRSSPMRSDGGRK
ncbi:hypothetical protein [Methylococcus geothermalis]